MNFKLYMELFGNFNYQTPDSKKYQMFDFYMLSFLLGRSQYDKYRLKPSANKQSEMDEEDQQDYMLQEIADELLPKLKQDMLDAVFFSMSCESRHAIKYTSYPVGNRNAESLYGKIFSLNKDMQVLHDDFNIKRLTKRNIPEDVMLMLDKLGYAKGFEDHFQISKRVAAFIIMSKLAKSEGKLAVIHLIKDVFSKLNWMSSFGGKAWANIADGWLMLHDAKTQQQIIVAIDHIYDLQHNTGSVFNKVPSYLENASHRWLKDGLDFKANIKDPYEIIKYVSPVMKKLALRMLKSKMGTSYEDFMKRKSEEKREKESRLEPMITMVQTHDQFPPKMIYNAKGEIYKSHPEILSQSQKPKFKFKNNPLPTTNDQIMNSDYLDKLIDYYKKNKHYEF